MISAFLFLIILIVGVQILFGAGKVENYYKFLIWLILGPVALAIGFNHALWFWYGLPFWAQALSVVLLPFFASAFLRMLFPKAAWVKSLQSVLIDSLVYAVTFPLRFLFRATRLVSSREGRKIELNPLRPAAGRRPPVGINGKTDSKSDLFD